MYGLKYEEIVFIALRILKYLYDRKRQEFEKVIKEFDSLDCFQAEEIIFHAMWMMPDDVVGGVDHVDDYEYETVEFTHSSFSKYLEVGSEWARMHGRSSNILFQRKLEDLSEFFLEGPTYEVCNRECISSESCFRIKLWFSEDIGTTGELAQNLLDMLLYIERETAWMEAEMQKTKGKVIDFPEKKREEAA